MVELLDEEYAQGSSRRAPIRLFSMLDTFPLFSRCQKTKKLDFSCFFFFWLFEMLFVNLLCSLFYFISFSDVHPVGGFPLDLMPRTSWVVQEWFCWVWFMEDVFRVLFGSSTSFPLCFVGGIQGGLIETLGNEIILHHAKNSVYEDVKYDEWKSSLTVMSLSLRNSSVCSIFAVFRKSSRACFLSAAYERKWNSWNFQIQTRDVLCRWNRSTNLARAN